MTRWTLLDHRPTPPRPQRAAVTTGIWVSGDPVTGRGVVEVFDVAVPVRFTGGVYVAGAVVRVTLDVSGRPVWVDPPASLPAD